MLTREGDPRLPPREPAQSRPRQARPDSGRTRCVFGGGTSLRFHTDAEWESYQRDIAEVEMRHYHRLRQRYGIWAGNQDKYVQSLDELKEADSRHMENRYAAWLAQQEKSDGPRNPET